jgi:hypothetical protein
MEAEPLLGDPPSASKCNIERIETICSALLCSASFGRLAILGDRSPKVQHTDVSKMANAIKSVYVCTLQEWRIYIQSCHARITFLQSIRGWAHPCT